MSIAEMDVYLHDVLTKVQRKYPSILPDTVNVKEEKSTYRSLRQGATSKAQSAGIPKRQTP